MKIILCKGECPDKQFTVWIDNECVHFGDQSERTFPQHKSLLRKAIWVSQRIGKQDWTITGIYGADFWCRWLLWNHQSLGDSIKDVESRFGITVNVR